MRGAVPGYDDRLLVRLSVQKGTDPNLFEKVPGIETVSQEDDAVVLLFVSEKALADFEGRLSSMIKGDKITNEQVLFAISALGGWTREDRLGPALRHEGLPTKDSFMLDVELWPLEKRNERTAMLAAFDEWLSRSGIERLDRAQGQSIIIYRVRVSRASAELLLQHRDVRRVDLPPRYGLERTLLTLPISAFPPVPAPADDAPRIAVLDSGLSSSHPLLGSAVGDNRNYQDPSAAALDACNHGTPVAGIALYGNIEACIESRSFQPEHWILSAKVLDDNCESDSKLLINQVRSAVDDFTKDYGCRIYNLSIGDLAHPYEGGHLAGLAVQLDELAREKGILFVVAAGNYEVTADTMTHRNGYPEYLKSSARILDPATSINSITVGSLARFDQSFHSRDFPHDPAVQPIARRNQPSPFTRSGPTVARILKPDFVEYGGNTAVDAKAGNALWKGLGEVSLNAGFAGGNLFCENSGTSFAAPRVAHYAAGILKQIPDASANLMRCILAVHANQPRECLHLLDDEEERANTAGYGLIDPDYLYRSGDDVVTLYAEEAIENKKNHFFEIPVPESYFTGRSRKREIHVALAYTPPVRSTRIRYKASRISFNLVKNGSLSEVMAYFNGKPADEIENMPEFGAPSRTFGKKLRSRGTLQKSSWVLKRPGHGQKFFLVVTRNDETWARGITEERESYSLAILLTDRENQQARLHAEIRQMIMLREQQRTRTRRR